MAATARLGRRRPLKALMVRVAIVVLGVAVVVGALWVDHTHPRRQLGPIPAAPAIGPGIGIDITRADGSHGISCTAGFLVRTADSRPGLLSAGHCNEPGSAGTVAIHHGGLYVYPNVGRFAQSEYGGNDWSDFDIGLIILDDSGKIPLTSDVDGHPLVGLAERVQAGEVLCHFGIRSNEAVCGPVIVVEENKVRFAATGRCGDSGGPVYRLRPDGAAEAVGIYVEVSNGDYSEPTCAEPQKFSIAQLIKPWLKSWELTLVTS